MTENYSQKLVHNDWEYLWQELERDLKSKGLVY